MTGRRPDQRAAARRLGEALRSLQQRSGRTLRSLEAQVRISDSSLSRYFRGETVPTWPVVRDLCRAMQADPAEYRALWEAAGPARPDEPADTGAPEAAGPSPLPRLAWWRRLRGLSRRRAVAAAAVVAAGLVTGLLLLLPPPGAPGTEPPQGGAGGSGDAGVLVHNVEQVCQKPRTNECALSLAYSPYRPYVTSNSADRVWHQDLLRARCTVADGVTVTDENHKHTSIWIQVTRDGKHLWLPGIRVRPDHLSELTAVLPACAP
ncbi:helix-turn-helix domain-containing protein [Streptomyces sp. MUM 203J]|uniref:helix-turn-helix domain-containing protein n=1 Tax=Streptomyces sp. MUM 203J TaxID=2791990 RepID=UPI001F047511|nr:helix-turn-helix transcriptional regulator [Streptomyces sp. MUM 203J]MCH0540189.1 helix-turn-helix domain-containing protein [Streptomyces sp. MUM 203J]